jgi:hypothetical protein
MPNLVRPWLRGLTILVLQRWGGKEALVDANDGLERNCGEDEDEIANGEEEVEEEVKSFGVRLKKGLDDMQVNGFSAL